MEFSRIDEETVRCVMTEQDLMERGIELEDFFKNKEKVQSFFEEIVEEAKKEVDYESSSGVLAVQVMPLPENGLAIIFSENPQINFEGLLKNIKDAVGDIKGNLTIDQLKQDVGGKDQGEKKNKSNKEQPLLRIYCFSDLQAVEMYCSVILTEKRVKSQLLKDEKSGDFYLLIEKGRLSAKFFNAVCERAADYAEYVSDQNRVLVFMKEHMTCMIEKNAVAVMGRIAKG